MEHTGQPWRTFIHPHKPFGFGFLGIGLTIFLFWLDCSWFWSDKGSSGRDLFFDLFSVGERGGGPKASVDKGWANGAPPKSSVKALTSSSSDSGSCSSPKFSRLRAGGGSSSGGGNPAPIFSYFESLTAILRRASSIWCGSFSGDGADFFPDDAVAFLILPSASSPPLLSPFGIFAKF